MKYKIGFSLWLGSLIGLLSVAIALAQVQPKQVDAPTAPSLTLSTDLVEATVDSTSITLGGQGFAGTLMRIVTRSNANPGFTNTAIATNGSFSFVLTIPIRQTPDVWTITVDSNVANDRATIQFYAFRWAVLPLIGNPGSSVQIAGDHFPPARTMALTFSATNARLTNLGNIVTDKLGNFTTSAIVPADATVGRSSFVLNYGFIGFLALRSFKTFAVPTDLHIAHLEFTQAIQRWDNSVRLILGKPLVVRVYVQANGPPGTLAGGKLAIDGPLLDVHHGATLLGTLNPTNRIVEVAPFLIDPKTLRGTTGATFNFLIPGSWTFVDGIDVRVTLNTLGTTPEINTANNTMTTRLFFQRTYPLQVVGLMYADPLYPYPAVPYTNYNVHIDFLKRTWPVPTVNLWQIGNPALTYSTRLGTDPNNPYYPGGGTVARDADRRRQQASAPYNTYNWYVLAPWDTCGCGTSLFEPAKGAVGQDNRAPAYQGVVMAQEIGHNFNQLHTGHTDPTNFSDPACCPNGGISVNPADPAFGFDTSRLQVINPGDLSGVHTHDFMSYGAAPIWISDYTYEHLLAKLFVRPPPGLEAQVSASAVLTDHPYLFVGGVISASVGTLDPAYVLDRPIGTDDQPGSGSYAIDLRDQNDQVLFTRAFDLNESQHPESGAAAFTQIMPYNPLTQRLVLRNGAEILATRTVSPHAPTVTILKPQAGVHWNGARQVTWSASDEDGDPLFFAVHYSSDNGQSWLPLAVDVISNTLAIDANLLTGSRNCLVRVIATDGINTTVAQSGVFGVDFHPPTVALLSDPVVHDNDQITLSGVGFDADEGPLTDEKLTWSSDRDGALGNGQTLVTTALSEGLHLITLTATDADGNQATTTVEVQVGHPIYLPLVMQ